MALRRRSDRGRSQSPSEDRSERSRRSSIGRSEKSRSPFKDDEEDDEDDLDEPDSSPRASRGRSSSSSDRPRSSSSNGGSSRGGWSRLEQHQKEQEEIEERRKRSKEESKHKLYEVIVNDGEYAWLQFLNEEPVAVEIHTMKSKYGRIVNAVCQKDLGGSHCTLCDDGNKARTMYAWKVLDFRGEYSKDAGGYDWGDPVERLFLKGAQAAGALKVFSDKLRRKKSSITEVVTEVIRTGKSNNSTYVFDVAENDSGEPEPIYDDWEEEKDSLEEALEPISDDDIDYLELEPMTGGSSNSRDSGRGGRSGGRGGRSGGRGRGR